VKTAGVLGPRSYKRIPIPEEWDVAERRAADIAAHVDPLEQRAKIWPRLSKLPLAEQIRHHLSIMKNMHAGRVLEHMPKVAFVEGFLDEMGKLGWKDQIPGGKADKKAPTDFDPKQLSKGRSHEREHTKSDRLATEIAMDHLTEDPKYYDKLEKVEKTAGAGVLAGAALPWLTGAAWPAAIAWLPGTLAGHAGQYAAVMGSRRVRDFLGRHGRTLLRTGFKHAIEGKKVSSLSKPALLSGVLAGATPMSTYQTGWNIGNAVAHKLEFLPGMQAREPLKVLQALDTAIQTTLKSAPVAGGLLGAGAGLAGEKALHPRRKLRGREVAKSMLTGAATGGLLGMGVSHFGPGLPGPKHLHEIRTKYIDDIVKGTNSKIEKMFDRAAKPIRFPRPVAAATE